MRWIVLLHVATAFGLIAGTVGRNLSLARARQSDDIRVVGALVDLAGSFERWMVIPGSFAVLAAGVWAAVAEGLFTASGNRWLLISSVLFVALFTLVPTIFVPKGKVFEAALTEARSQGVVTPALTDAFRDPAVTFARSAEAMIVAVIIVLMVVKPF